LFSAEILNAEETLWLRKCQQTYTIYLDLSFEVWAKKQLSKKSYKTYKDLINKYKKSSSWSLQQYYGQDGLSKWNIFLELESSGWKGVGGSSIKMLPENYQLFYQGVLSQLAERGDLTISLLEYEHKYIAGAFMYREGDVLHIFKAGFNEEFRHLSPSNMLLLENVRFQSELPDAPRILHLFPSDFGYKGRYANTELHCVATEIFNSTLRGYLTYLYRKLKNTIKTRLPKKED